MPADTLAQAREVRPTILVVDDDAGVRESFRMLLEDTYDVLDVPDGTRALELLGTCHVDLVLLDVRLPGVDGLGVLERIKALDEDLEVILVTAVQTMRTAVTAMKLGAFDCLAKPFDESEVLALIRRALDRRALAREIVVLRSELARVRSNEIVGLSAVMRRLHAVVAQVAATTATVLITGETGTGKELVARAIHRQSARHDKPFVPVNAAALPDTLVESELFGHERGAFTGAVARKLGKFELAQGGTLFLDEIADLRPELQAKLLRALQEREIERVGGTRHIGVDVRVVAATNQDLRRAVASGSFRQDLFYRLNVVPIVVPPLREHREDLPALVEHFVAKYNREFKKQVAGISADALVALRAYTWPGNVRELENIIERAVVLSPGPVIELADLPPDLAALPDGAAVAREVESAMLSQAMDQFERAFLRRVLDRVGWNQREAAKALGLHRNSLAAKLVKHGLLDKDDGGETEIAGG
jgi:DNA-binding NtrC family response regulator